MLTRTTNDHGARAREREYLIVARPRRRRDEDLITVAEENEAAVEQRLLAPGRNHDLVGQHIVDFQVRARAPGNGLTQRQDSFDERVSSRARVKRALRALADEARCREVGLARAEVDDRAARGAE